MTSMKRAKAVLYLADGTLFEGLSIGKKGTSGGEICFNTGMVCLKQRGQGRATLGLLMVRHEQHTEQRAVVVARKPTPLVDGRTKCSARCQLCTVLTARN